MELIFASSNKNKIFEISRMLPSHIRLLGFEDIGFKGEIEETGDTFRENAAIKANLIHQLTGLPCFADDSGLMVEALHNQPGVRSARYAGEPVNHDANINLLLKELKGIINRKAVFTTVICYKDSKQELFFEGEVSGKITEERKGNNGFGYDPVFIPENNSNTFAEMNPEEKNKISHRKRALEKMIRYLGSEQS